MRTDITGNPAFRCSLVPVAFSCATRLLPVEVLRLEAVFIRATDEEPAYPFVLSDEYLNSVVRLTFVSLILYVSLRALRRRARFLECCTYDG